MKQPYSRFVIAALILCLCVSAAQAQPFGGGGGGLLQPILQWFVTNFVQSLIAVGILVVGAMCVFSRHSMAGIAIMIVGALIMANYQTIAGLFPTGG